METTQQTDEQKAAIEQRKADERAAYIQGIRELADFFERNPALKDRPMLMLNVWCDTAQEFVDWRRALGVSDKHDIGDAVYLHKVFSGGVSLDVNISKEKTCKRVPTGKKVMLPGIKAVPPKEVDEYVWECGSVLAAADAEQQQ